MTELYLSNDLFMIKVKNVDVSGVPSEEAEEAVPPLTSRPSDALILFKQKIHVHTLLIIFHEGKY